MKNWLCICTILIVGCICFGCIYHELNVADKVSKMHVQYEYQLDSVNNQYKELKEQLNKLQYAFEQQNAKSNNDTIIIQIKK